MAECWVSNAISKIEADFNRSTDTHLIKVPLPCCPDIDLYLKDESIHPSGSLKHRLARSLFLYAICNGWIREGTPVVEASSGSTAISEAYFSQLLDLPFHTVIPACTSKKKIQKIEFLGGKCHLVNATDMELAAAKLARELNGHFMDQFTYAERATDWRGNNNIADSLFRQMSCESFPEPTWVVMSAGTGGTSATIGRYIRYQKLMTKLCVVDPDNSVFFDYYRSGDRGLTNCATPRIEGIGRPRVELSFIPTVVDRMIQVPDAASIAALDLVVTLIDRRCGGSTGTNLIGAIHLMSEMQNRGESGSIVTVICDGGDRYLDTYYSPDWRQKECPGVELFAAQLDSFLASGMSTMTLDTLQFDSRKRSS